MKHKKIEVNLGLTSRATKEAKAKVVDDLNIEDPEPDVGKQIVEDIIDGKDNNDD